MRIEYLPGGVGNAEIGADRRTAGRLERDVRHSGLDHYACR